ncbi:CPBP family intramembrane glutamic endopeptidase [Proteus mirabilis]|uniref:CPBP family intramembrane glutamic endopeptidase n=1 Tax=Proteus mirabilis TaxID=584 RepID=UPI000789E9D4|nr:type II CAAX endopeptidase family protein [Proteus mirabilis]
MITWLLLALSLLLLGFHRKLALTTLAITTISAFITGVITWYVLPVILSLILLSCAYRHYKTNRLIATIVILAFIAIIVGLTFHFIPSFNNLRYIKHVPLGQYSPPFSFYFNADKALIPFILMIFIPTLFKTEPVKKANKYQWVLLAMAIPALLLFAMALGGLAIELHLPQWLPAFMLANIFFVSLAEEALFRGAIQQSLSRYLSPYLALFITAILFGLVHFAGGILLIIFASLAGIIYGLAWMWSGRLWVATLFHFALNLTHLLFFTYPFKIA